MLEDNKSGNLNADFCCGIMCMTESFLLVCCFFVSKKERGRKEGRRKEGRKEGRKEKERGWRDVQWLGRCPLVALPRGPEFGTHMAAHNHLFRCFLLASKGTSHIHDVHI